MKCDHKPDFPIGEFVMNYGIKIRAVRGDVFRCKKCNREIILKKRHTLSLLYSVLVVLAISWCLSVAIYRVCMSLAVFFIAYAVFSVAALTVFLTKYVELFYEFTAKEELEDDTDTARLQRKKLLLYLSVALAFLVVLMVLV